MTQPLEIHLRTLTPLWTGGVDGTMDRIHATGIIGSLRWWYEAIVRGLGGNGCDPSTHTCPDKDGNYCDVCAVFGATGLQRAFHLKGPIWQNDAAQRRLTIKVNNNRGWYLGRGFLDEGTLKLLPLRSSGSFRRDDLVQTMLLMSQLVTCWGGLGPKTQQGYGVTHLHPTDISLVIDQAIKSFYRLKERNNRKVVHSNSEWPSLERFFFAKIRFSENNPEQWVQDRTSSIHNDEMRWYLNGFNRTQEMRVLPLASVVRYHLRSLIREHIQHNGHPNAPARWRLMGIVTGYWHNQDYGKIARGQHNQWRCTACGAIWHTREPQKIKEITLVERQASLIHVSHAYPVDENDWEFRIWGWLPDELAGNVDRDTLLQHLRQWLGVQKHRQWHRTTGGELWDQQKVNVAAPSVLWFEKSPDESGAEYLQNLLTEQVHETGASQ